MVDQRRTKPDLFAQYISLRQSGLKMNDVVQSLQDAAYQLSRDERHQLGKAVQDWEAENSAIPNVPRKQMGQMAQTSADAQPGQLLRRASTPVTSLLQAAQATSLVRSTQAAPGPAAFGTRFLDPTKFPGSAVSPAIRPIEMPPPVSEQLACPTCGRNNKPNEVYCFSCGNILEASDTMTKPLEKGYAKGKLATANFAQTDSLRLVIRGYSNDIQVKLKDEMVLGRTSAQGSVRPDIDLSSYNAENQGVSRLHAAFRRQDDTIVLVDLGSANKTFINGQRVYPHEVRVLRSGDEIRLGKMMMKVIFKRS